MKTLIKNITIVFWASLFTLSVAFFYDIIINHQKYSLLYFFYCFAIYLAECFLFFYLYFNIYDFIKIYFEKRSQLFTRFLIQVLAGFIYAIVIISLFIGVTFSSSNEPWQGLSSYLTNDYWALIIFTTAAITIDYYKSKYRVLRGETVV